MLKSSGATDKTRRRERGRSVVGDGVENEAGLMKESRELAALDIISSCSVGTGSHRVLEV